MKIKVLSWNIWYYGHFKKIVAFLKKFDADIIGLQEVVINDKDRNVITYLTRQGYQHIFSPVMKMTDGRIVGNAIFSKYEILNHNIHQLSEEEARNALETKIKVDDKTLNVFCTHLFHTHQQPSKIQELQAENLIKVLPDQHVIVMGDFNATPNSVAVTKISNVLVNADKILEPTWSVYPEGCVVCKPHAVEIRLDYIFTSNDIKTDSFTIHNSKGSDHLPISVNIEI